ncbi:MAG: NAD-dependent epimerase/dehydratase family protein [Deltaproteobacteria bacterium]|nr:NAD-dependent epimerase/dehydratase family protein [Deltaproteobacteria bacterium]
MLVEAAKKAQVPRFIYISTTAIILRGKPVYDADENLVIPGLPRGNYSKTKVLAEDIVLSNNSAEFETIIPFSALVCRFETVETGGLIRICFDASVQMMFFGDFFVFFLQTV